MESEKRPANDHYKPDDFSLSEDQLVSFKNNGCAMGDRRGN
jgi:hypothetical protein